MKRNIIFLVSIFLTTVLHAQLLWQVSGNNMTAPSYIFGTHHIAPSRFIDSVPGLNDAINNVEQVYVEVELDSLVSHHTQQLIFQRSIAPADSTLEKLLSVDDYTLVDSVISQYLGMKNALSYFKSINPATILTQLQVLEASKHFDHSDDEQIDGAVQLKAMSLGKKIFSLETVESQLDVLCNVPLTEQAEDLLEVCRNASLFFEYNRLLSERYQAQDLEGLWELMTDDELGTNEMQAERMIFSRNRAWVIKLSTDIIQHPTLICVGAGHLPGEQGLINLFRAIGFTVTPIIE